LENINIDIQWRTAVVEENGNAYNFPKPFPFYFCEKYAISAVYRWRVLREAGEPKEEIYIGEAEDLVQRIQRVRTPAKTGKTGNTNERLNKIFGERLSAGRIIVLEVADIQPFTVNGIRFDESAASDRFKRRALENLLLVIAQKNEQFTLLNTIVDPLSHAERLIRKLKPHQVRELLRKYAPPASS
jgi:hypothetical protein